MGDGLSEGATDQPKREWSFIWPGTTKRRKAALRIFTQFLHFDRGAHKKKKKEILSYVNSQSETKKILETANQKAGKAVLKTEGIAVPETDRDLGWWITIPNSLLGFNCQRIFHFIIFGSQWYIPYRYTRYTHAYLENAFLQLHLTKRGWILF